MHVVQFYSQRLADTWIRRYDPAYILSHIDSTDSQPGREKKTNLLRRRPLLSCIFFMVCIWIWCVLQSLSFSVFQWLDRGVPCSNVACLGIHRLCAVTYRCIILRLRQLMQDFRQEKVLKVLFLAWRIFPVDAFMSENQPFNVFDE